MNDHIVFTPFDYRKAKMTLCCCWINPENGEPCGERAEWSVLLGTMAETSTNSCTAHVGYLLSPDYDLFTIRPIVYAAAV